MAPKAEKSQLLDTRTRDHQEETSRPDRLSPCSETGARNPYAAMAVCGLLLLAVALVFGQMVRHEFVNFDDQSYVYENLHVQNGVTPQGLVWAFTNFCANNWHPLTWLSHMLDVQAYGLWAGGHHLTNVLLHATSVIVLFLVLRQMTGRLWPSALVAALFAIHPLHVESVAWVAERKDVLSGLFFALTLAAYLGYVRRPFSVLRYLLVVVCFALGLLSKPMLVTLPLVLLLLDYWPLGRFGATRLGALRSGLLRLIVEKIPLLLLAAASCVATLMAQASAMVTLERLPFGYRAANALVSYVAYLGQSLWPTGLAIFYPHPQDALSWWTVGGCLLLLVSVSTVVVMGRRSRPYLLVGWLWYLGMLVPVIGLVQVGAQIRADRYMYLPLIGPSLALAWTTMEFAASSFVRRWLCGTAWLLALVSLAGLSWQQASTWRDSETLWTHALTCTTRNGLAHNNLGVTLSGRGQVDSAIAHYQQALEIKPDYAEGHYNLGNALAGRGRVDSAVAHYRQALEVKPDYAEACNNLGNALAGRGQIDSAITYYRKTLEIKPDYAEAHYNLGIALAGRGQIDSAIAHYQQALEIKPDDAEVHNHLADALAGRGQVDEAIGHYQKALEIKPNYAEALYNLANALAGRGRVDEAIAHYRKALEVRPDCVEAHNNLAVALTGRGQVEEAIAHYRKALEIKPDYVDAHNNLGAALAARGQVDSAIAHYRKALEIKPDYAGAHYNLAVVLAARGQVDEAVAHYRKALEIKPDHVKARRSLSVALSAREEILKSLAQRREAIRLQPNNAALLNDTAWMLATNPNASVRNGAEALELAQRALKLSGGDESAILGTLAAAYAETSRFPEAVRTAEQAVRMAAAKGDRMLAEQIRTCLELYSSGKPYRQPPGH